MIHLMKERFLCNELLPNEETIKVIMERLACNLSFEGEVSSPNTA